MKKVFLICLAAIFMLAISGCAERRAAVVPVTKGISFKADITYYNESYECKVKISEDESLTAEMTSPDDIKGMTVTCIGDKITAQYGGLSYDYKLSGVPLGSVCTAVYDVFHDTWQNDAVVIEDKQNFYIEGETEKSRYKMTVAPTGLPLSLEIPDESFYVEFREVTIIS